MLCKYKDIFGKVGQGVHSYRLFGVAIVDVLLTILCAYIIYILGLFPKYNYACILLGLFLLGIVLHHLFCVRTTIDKILFP